MSAYIVGRRHIDALITAASGGAGYLVGLSWWDRSLLELRDIPYPTRVDHLRRLGPNANVLPSEAGRMLWAENVASVQARYPDTVEAGHPGPTRFGVHDVAVYRFRRFPGPLDPVGVLKSIACYQYQSCEHDGWLASQAYQFCESLTQKTIGRPPGHDAANWGPPDCPEDHGPTR